MHDFRSLKFLDLFQAVFSRIGIDYKVLRKILQIKLIMDQRRIPTILQGNMNGKKKEGNQFAKSLGIYVLYGLILIPFLFLGDHYMYQMSIIFGISMFILMTSMISDFSAVLLDVRDKTILQTKPVHKKTINAAKILHITIYMVMLTGAFIAIPAITMLFTHGFVFFILFLAEMVLLVLFIMALTALIYIFVLRFFDGERLKDIINYVQILLSVGIVIGYQIVARAFDLADLQLTYMFSWWHLFIPPLWFAAPYELLLKHNAATTIMIYCALALIVPIVSIVLYAVLMPVFEDNLQKLSEHKANQKRYRRGIGGILEPMVCFNKEERLFFRFSENMMKRERDFKLKVYPSLGMAFVFPFIFLFQTISMESYTALINSKGYFNIYFSLLMIGVVVHMLQFSSNYKGAWIFHAAPIQRLNRFYSAALKAFLVKLFLPVYTVLSVIFLGVFSFAILPDLLVVFICFSARIPLLQSCEGR